MSLLAPPARSPASECVPPPEPKGGGGQHSLAGEGTGGANSDDWRESLALCLLCELQYLVTKDKNYCQCSASSSVERPHFMGGHVKHQTSMV